MLISCNDWGEDPGGPGGAWDGTLSILATYERPSKPTVLALDLRSFPARDVEGP